MASNAELLPGTVDLLVLRALALGSTHGYGISRLIRTRSQDVINLQGPALYQALQRLEAQKLIVSEWGLSETNRKAKYYELTALGRTRLESERRNWQRYANAMAGVLVSP